MRHKIHQPPQPKCPSCGGHGGLLYDALGHVVASCDMCDGTGLAFTNRDVAARQQREPLASSGVCDGSGQHPHGYDFLAGE
jgi:DnaJ-class molecular chaperone